MTGALRAVDVTATIDRREILHAVDVEVPSGQTTVIVGPNGSGKSTLLRSLGRLQPHAGSVLLDGGDVARMTARAYARRVAMLPQSPAAPDNLTVLDLVTRGRDPHRRWYDQWSAADERIVLDALARTGLEALSDRPLETLSGGQRQRAWIALALAQSADVLLLDEPTTYLDIAHQLDVLETLAELRRDHGLTVVMVLHDLALAVRYADRIIVVDEGAVVGAGAPEAIVTAALMRDVFDIEASVLDDPHTGRPVIVPHRAIRPPS